MLNLFKRSKVAAPLLPDLTVADVELGGMSRLMVSRLPLAYYLVSLLEDYCSENLFFHLEATYFKASAEDMTPEELEVNATHIFKTYLESNSPFEVNVDFKVRKECEEALEKRKDLGTMFEAASQHVFKLLEASYAKFMRGPYAAKLRLEQDGVEDCTVTAKSRDEAMAIVVARVQEQADHGKEVDAQMAEEREVALQHMVAEFCRTVLDVPTEGTLAKMKAAKKEAERARAKKVGKK